MIIRRSVHEDIIGENDYIIRRSVHVDIIGENDYKEVCTCGYYRRE